MEVIQEYSENLSYLNALLACNRFEFQLQIPDVSEAEVNAKKLAELPDEVFKEPLGRFFFRYHLLAVRNCEHLLFINDVDEYAAIPRQQAVYRAKIARKLLQKYLSAGAKLEVGVPYTTRAATFAQFQRHGGMIGLFDAARHASLYHLRLGSFASFLESAYYKRLLAFRSYELRPVSTDDFDFLRVLGEGGFGKVYAVSKKDTRAVYACKTMSKQRILERQREQLIINERKILELVNHQNLVCLRYAFQDDHALHLMLDLMSGGELQFHLNRFGKFDLHTVRFYAAGLVLGLEYLHSKGIIYRDLKPENIMLDADGYVQITDLGLCAFIKDGERLHKHCGTRSYMAPEQCHGNQGYGKAADWWSLGVTVYQLLTGKNPFSQRSKRTTRKPVPPQPNAAIPINPNDPNAIAHAGRSDRAALAAMQAAAAAQAAGGGATMPGMLPGMIAPGGDDPNAAAAAAANGYAYGSTAAGTRPGGRDRDRDRELGRAEREHYRQERERERRHAAAAVAAAAAAQQQAAYAASGMPPPANGVDPSTGKVVLPALTGAGATSLAAPAAASGGPASDRSARRERERERLAASLISMATAGVYGPKQPQTPENNQTPTSATAAAHAAARERDILNATASAPTTTMNAPATAPAPAPNSDPNAAGSGPAPSGPPPLAAIRRNSAHQHQSRHKLAPLTVGGGTPTFGAAIAPADPAPVNAGVPAGAGAANAAAGSTPARRSPPFNSHDSKDAAKRLPDLSVGSGRGRNPHGLPPLAPSSGANASSNAPTVEEQKAPPSTPATAPAPVTAATAPTTTSGAQPPVATEEAVAAAAAAHTTSANAAVAALQPLHIPQSSLSANSGGATNVLSVMQDLGRTNSSVNPSPLLGNSTPLAAQSHVPAAPPSTAVAPPVTAHATLTIPVPPSPQVPIVTSPGSVSNSPQPSPLPPPAAASMVGGSGGGPVIRKDRTTPIKFASERKQPPNPHHATVGSGEVYSPSGGVINSPSDTPHAITIGSSGVGLAHGFRLPTIPVAAGLAAVASHANVNPISAYGPGTGGTPGGGSHHILAVPDTPGAGVGRPSAAMMMNHMMMLPPPSPTGITNPGTPANLNGAGSGTGADTPAAGTATGPKLRVVVKHEREKAVSHTPTKFEQSATSIRQSARNRDAKGHYHVEKFRLSRHQQHPLAAVGGGVGTPTSGTMMMTPGSMMSPTLFGPDGRPLPILAGTAGSARLGADGKYLDRKDLELMQLQQQQAMAAHEAMLAAGGAGGASGAAPGTTVVASSGTRHHYHRDRDHRRDHMEVASIFNSLPITPGLPGANGSGPAHGLLPGDGKGGVRLAASAAHHHVGGTNGVGVPPATVMLNGQQLPHLGGGAHHAAAGSGGLVPGHHHHHAGSGGGGGVAADGIRHGLVHGSSNLVGVGGINIPGHMVVGGERGSKSQLAQTKRYNELIGQYKDILRSMQWPEDDAARSFCRELLALDDSKRLGAGGAHQLRAHPFFHGFDWDKMLNRHMTPPFVPDSNFVHADYIEAAIIAPPKTKSAKPAHKFKGFEYTRPFTFQEEVLNVIHNKQALIDPTVGPRPGQASAAAKLLAGATKQK